MEGCSTYRVLKIYDSASVKDGFGHWKGVRSWCIAGVGWKTTKAPGHTVCTGIPNQSNTDCTSTCITDLTLSALPYITSSYLESEEKYASPIHVGKSSSISITWLVTSPCAIPTASLYVALFSIPCPSPLHIFCLQYSYRIFNIRCTCITPTNNPDHPTISHLQTSKKEVVA